MKKFVSIILSVLLLSCFMLASCGDPTIKDTVSESGKWVTEADAEGVSIRWEFTDKTVKAVTVIDGEDTFVNSYNYKAEGFTLIFENDYEKLIYETEAEGDTLTAKGEDGKVLVFKKS